MAAVFELVFELFGLLYGEESRYTPLDFRKGYLNHYFVGTARQNVSACLFWRKFLAVCRGRFDRR